jgi:hypothetical protein
MEQHWKVGEVIPPFSANQKCRGVSSGTELTLKCTITAGTPGYQPDEFKLTRNNSEVWGGTMAVGTSTRRMAVNFFRVS